MGDLEPSLAISTCLSPDKITSTSYLSDLVSLDAASSRTVLYLCQLANHPMLAWYKKAISTT